MPASIKKILDKHLHIICLNVPYPVDYGGVFDLFYKLPALQQQGVKIHLHCFDYGRGPQPELNLFCESVDYYPRKKGFAALSFSCPYIVKSRTNKLLLNRLLKDDYPVLMEGVHCTYLLKDRRFKKSRCFVRLHNVEHIYYRQLYHHAVSPLHKMYFFWESRLLKSYEKSIVKKSTFWSVIEKDAEVYRALGCRDIDNLPLFLPAWKVNTHEGNGSFCLYQGDLSVAENEKAATWLVTSVFNDLQMPFVIAGKNPSASLVQLTSDKMTMCLIANPDEKEMQDMIAKAHINIVPSFSATGIKLKLINALFNGRHCLVNEATIDGSGLEKACNIAGSASEFKAAINQLYGQPFDKEEIQLREQLLYGMFNNERNATQMIKWIFG